MKFFNVITSNRPSFISDDVIEELINGKQIKKNDKDFVTLLTKMRLNSCDLGIQEFLRTMHYYNFANTQKDGLIINIPLLSSALNKPDTIEILKRDFFVSTMSQLYITLDALISATPIDVINTKDFFAQREKILTAKLKLKNDYINVLKNSNHTSINELNKVLFGNIVYGDKKYTLIKFAHEFPNDNPAFVNNDFDANTTMLSSINSFIQRSAEK